MPTYNIANHPNRFKRMATPDRDPLYPKQSYYADHESAVVISPEVDARVYKALDDAIQEDERQRRKD